jgi:hypothetical protein
MTLAKSLRDTLDTLSKEMYPEDVAMAKYRANKVVKERTSELYQKGLNGEEAYLMLLETELNHIWTKEQELVRKDRIASEAVDRAWEANGERR